MNTKFLFAFYTTLSQNQTLYESINTELSLPYDEDDDVDDEDGY